MGGKLAFSPDGTRLAYTAADGTVRVLALDIDDLIQLARSRLTRSWSPDECRTYLHVESCPSTEISAVLSSSRSDADDVHTPWKATHALGDFNVESHCVKGRVVLGTEGNQ